MDLGERPSPATVTAVAGLFVLRVITPGQQTLRSQGAEAGAHLSDEGVLVLEVGHERPHFERAFPRLECAWLETSGGPDRVVLVERAALPG